MYIIIKLNISGLYLFILYLIFTFFNRILDSIFIKRKLVLFYPLHIQREKKSIRVIKLNLRDLIFIFVFYNCIENEFFFKEQIVQFLRGKENESGGNNLFNLGLPLISRDLVRGDDLKHFKSIKKYYLLFEKKYYKGKKN